MYVQQAVWSDEDNDQPDAATRFVIHGEHIEILSDSDDDAQDDSPMTRLVPATFQPVKKGEH